MFLKEPLPATPFMEGSGGGWIVIGWIVIGWVVTDRM
jgi:hypothetical protein